MALHLLRRVTHAGMDELANWTAKTYKFTLHNNTGSAVRALLEEDPDGMAELEEWKIGDGIPTIGKAGERHKQKISLLKKSISSSKPYQEFTIIRDQTKTVNMRSPVIKCSLALLEWNGAMKIVEIQRRMTEGNTLTIHPGYDRMAGLATLRSDALEHALQALGVKLGFDSEEVEVKKDSKESRADLPPWLQEPPPLPAPKMAPTVPTAPQTARTSMRPRPTSAVGRATPKTVSWPAEPVEGSAGARPTQRGREGERPGAPIAQAPHGFGVAGGACPMQRGHEGERPGAPIGQAQHGFGVAGGACPMQRGHEGERPGAPIAQAQHGFGVAGGACPMLRGHEDERPGSPAAQAPHGFLPMTGQIWLWHEEQQWVSANLVACLGPGKEGGSRSSFNCIFLHHAMQCKVA
ncbi:unnamed protein product [Durusdinium trenchii]|uniref:Uncharacterized protein n=1 Tax=Durusdinium trenchii TaxID=1381693 RepID=A0ABP0PD69_9DINO